VTSTFADTVYFIALLNPRDQFHHAALRHTASFQGRMKTTAWVMTEVANQMSRPPNRASFLALLHDLAASSSLDIVPPSIELYEEGLRLYTAREDKEWSLTDCISFIVMEQGGIVEALTADHHFEQAGFTMLLDG